MLVHDAILRTAGNIPDRDALRFLAHGEDVTERLTYGALAEQSLIRANRLAAAGLSGRAVALILEPGALFVEVLVACLMAGVIVSPLTVPRQPLSVNRVTSALSNLRAAAILTTAEIAALPALSGRAEPIICLDREEEPAPAGMLRRPAPGDPAVVQYSSGSTAEPRGIVLTHGNIAANLAMMRLAMEGQPGCVSVSWLPHSHDMGLFGTILAPLWNDSTAVLMPPQAFLRRPTRWLRAISVHGGTHSTAPNFGYALAARRANPADMAELDLSGWRIACIGAEPTLPATLEAFAAATEPAGFRPAAFRSCYGLAEATLLCTSGPLRAVGERVTCGASVEGNRIRLRAVAEAPADAGEVLIAGDHVSPGIWDPDEPSSLRPFDGVEVDADGTCFVPTGDLGIMSGTELVILDRLKDILPVRGGALGPTEVEQAACAVDERIEAAAAVPDAKPGSYVVRLAIEVNDRRFPRAERDALSRQLTDKLAELFGIETRVWFFASWELPRTTSGKIRRFAVRDLITAQEAADE